VSASFFAATDLQDAEGTNPHPTRRHRISSVLLTVTDEMARRGGTAWWAAAAPDDWCELVSEADVARYRREAEECRSRAAKAANPIEKESWQRMADEWLKLAQSTLAKNGPSGAH